MIETFIIDGKKVELEVLNKFFKANFLDVTSYSDRWEICIHSGIRFLTMQTIKNDNKAINITYQIIGKNEGFLVLKSIEKGRL